MFFSKEPIVTFRCAPELHGAIPDPVPANKATPKWFRKMPLDHGLMNDTVKRCLPFKDAMDMGYIIPLWLDLNVVNDGENISFSYKNHSVLSTPVFENHSANQLEGCPIVKTAYGNQPMKFMNPWLITTPPGWSCMFIQPINHFDGRLHIITGVVDTDKYINRVNFPFVWMDKEFNGTILQGTPVVQVIPFKRTKCRHSVGSMSDSDVNNIRKTYTAINTTFKNAYRLRFWDPKRYK